MTEETYTHGHHRSVLASHRWRTAENSAAHLLGHLRSGQSVLDVGCGPGTITADLARHVSPGEVTGIDRSAEIVAAAAAEFADVDHLRFAVGDVYGLQAPDGSVDVVHAHQVLQHLADPVAALREMRRVVAPDGLVAVRDADYSGFTWAPADDRLDRWLRLYTAVARHNGGEPDAGRHVLGWTTEAGFGAIEPGASVWCFATPADRRWWGELWADRMQHSAIGDQLLELGWTSSEELAGIAAAFRRWSTDPTGWFVVVHGEAICRPNGA